METKKPVYSTKILEAEKVTVQEDNSTLISVQFQVIKTGERELTEADFADESLKEKLAGKKVGDIAEMTDVSTPLRQGFALSHTAEEIQAELEKHAKLMQQEDESRVTNSERDNLNAQADATIVALLSDKK